MDGSLVEVALDISNRNSFVFNAEFNNPTVGDFDVELTREFFEKFAMYLGLTLHINLKKSTNTHHDIEAIFKCVAKSLDIATSFDKRIKGPNSSKGIL